MYKSLAATIGKNERRGSNANNKYLNYPQFLPSFQSCTDVELFRQPGVGTSNDCDAASTFRRRYHRVPRHIHSRPDDDAVVNIESR